jgi:hypothetical protein
MFVCRNRRLTGSGKSGAFAAAMAAAPKCRDHGLASWRPSSRTQLAVYARFVLREPQTSDGSLGVQAFVLCSPTSGPEKPAFTPVEKL